MASKIFFSMTGRPPKIIGSTVPPHAFSPTPLLLGSHVPFLEDLPFFSPYQPPFPCSLRLKETNTRAESMFYSRRVVFLNRVFERVLPHELQRKRGCKNGIFIPGTTLPFFCIASFFFGFFVIAVLLELPPPQSCQYQLPWWSSALYRDLKTLSCFGFFLFSRHSVALLYL